MVSSVEMWGRYESEKTMEPLNPTCVTRNTPTKASTAPVGTNGTAIVVTAPMKAKARRKVRLAPAKSATAPSTGIDRNRTSEPNETA